MDNACEATGRPTYGQLRLPPYNRAIWALLHKTERKMIEAPLSLARQPTLHLSRFAFPKQLPKPERPSIGGWEM